MQLDLKEIQLSAPAWPGRPHSPPPDGWVQVVPTAEHWARLMELIRSAPSLDEAEVVDIPSAF